MTDEITKAWGDKTTKEYKSYKNLKKESLRDNMTNVELILNMLAEGSTTQISKSDNPEGFEESRSIAREGGEIAGNARRQLEERTGKKIVSRNNSDDPKLLDE